MPRKDKSKRNEPISEKTSAEDERLRRELHNADPEQFKRIVKPLFRSSREEPKKNDAASL